MNKVLLVLILFALTLKLFPSPEPTGRFQAFWDIDFIVVYNADKLSYERFKEVLVHEFQHQLCWDLFKIYPKNVYDHNPRCFIN